MATFLYSALHFLVDFACAHAMYRSFSAGAAAYGYILIYNFCAFALQMPLGALIDTIAHRFRRLPEVFAAVGVGLTLLGAFTHPAILGLGNAMFHVGGGIGVIRDDDHRRWHGTALGVFVAPGALGLFLGAQLASVDIILLIGAAMFLLVLPLFRLPEMEQKVTAPSKTSPIPLLCCFLVVVLRSYVGMAVVFSWKSGFWLSLAAVCAVVLGKMAGGFCSARFGVKETSLCSLMAAAGCYLWSGDPLLGILALFFFNMTMPITLYQLVKRHSDLPGFCFGLLTFGLFLGFLPVYFNWALPVSGAALGCVGSAVSLLLLLPVVWRAKE